MMPYTGKGEGDIRIAMEQERADIELRLPLGGWFVVLVRLRLPLIIRRKTVTLHIIEKDVVGAAALGEDDNGGRDPGIGLEHSGGKRDHRF